MKNLLSTAAIAATILASGWMASTGTAQVPAKAAPAPAVAPAPAKVTPAHAAAPVVKKMRGAKSSRHHWLAYQATQHPRFVHVAAPAPAQFTPAVILTMAQMSYWGNNQFGDCVTAEEAASLDVISVWYSAAGMNNRVVLPDSTVTSWASQNGYLNGANLTDVMDSMAKVGIAYNNVTYTDGPYTSVDYTNWATLTSAIYQGPVKIGIASSQLDNTQAGNQNGWIGTGFGKNNNQDHCVGLWGYGTMTELCTAMGVTPPSNAASLTQCVLMYTWDTIGIVDFQSLNNICGEAWLRTPTHPQIIPIQPNPTPNPTPTPTGLTWALGPNAPAGASIDQNGNFTWAIPATQPAGNVSINFTVTPAGGAATNGSFVIVVSASTGGVTISPIPNQAAPIGGTFTLGLGQFVTQAKPPGIAPPCPAPCTGCPTAVPFAPVPAQPVLPSPQSPPVRKAA